MARTARRGVQHRPDETLIDRSRRAPEGATVSEDFGDFESAAVLSSTFSCFTATMIAVLNAVQKSERGRGENYGKARRKLQELRACSFAKFQIVIFYLYLNNRLATDCDVTPRV